MDTMTDREIAEETLELLRGITSMINMMMEQISESPMARMMLPGGVPSIPVNGLKVV